MKTLNRPSIDWIKFRLTKIASETVWKQWQRIKGLDKIHAMNIFDRFDKQQ